MAALKDDLQKNNLLFSWEEMYPRYCTDMLAQAEEAFKLKDDEAIGEQQVDESSKPTVEEK